LKEAKYN